MIKELLLMGRFLTTQAGRREFTGFEAHPSQPEGLQDLPPAPEDSPLRSDLPFGFLFLPYPS